MNTTVTFANTMATAASGYTYRVRVDWRDAGGRAGYGSVEAGPIAVPTVPAGKLATAPLHECAPSAAPAGKHATISAVTEWGQTP